VQPWHDAYIAGVLYKLFPNVSIYYNYTTDDALASANVLWQAGVQNEFGIKSNFLNDRISITADHFEIKQSNVSYQNPLFNTGQSTIQTIYANLTSNGEELNVVGGITKDLSLIASYTNLKLRDAYGRRQRNIPDNMANLLVDYHFNIFSEAPAKNADVFIGEVHQGDVAGETVSGFTPLGVPEQPGFFLAAYNVTNAGAGYTISNYRFNLNVNNVFNQRFWYEAAARATPTGYPGICIKLTVTVHM
jgi:iron complex outermembrane receptor protein